MADGPFGFLPERLRASAAPLSAFLGSVALAVVGYVLLVGVSVLEAVFWVLDPTSVELYFEAHDGPERATKAFTILTSVALVLSGIWVAESVLDAAFDGRIQEELQSMRTERTIGSMSGHVVICGHGMFGQTVAERLRSRGRDVVVVEADERECERVDDEVPALAGDARREDVLVDAGVERAAAVVAAIDDSNANIQVAVTADQLAPAAELVVRVGDEMYESTARRAGADVVVIPEVVSGTEVVEQL